MEKSQALINKDEFIKYFHFLSASIDEDSYFDAVLTNCFKLTFENQLTNKFAGIGGTGSNNYLNERISI